MHVKLRSNNFILAWDLFYTHVNCKRFLRKFCIVKRFEKDNMSKYYRYLKIVSFVFFFTKSTYIYLYLYLSIYRADVTNEANNDQKFYFGLAETAFKERYNNHKRDVKHIKYQYNTELTKCIWN